MKVAVISDFHLGAKKGDPREDDSFVQTREAFKRALDMGAQLILVPGDIFDERVPSQEVWSESMKILSLPSEGSNQDISLDDTIGRDRDSITALPLRGVPVIAIHGNHERRGRGFVDSIEALESAGLAIHLHHNTVVLDTPEGNLAVHGMGHVPKEYARDFVKEWNPSPVEGAFNVFIVHQDLGRFTFYSEGETTLEPADLPEGFDIYISGHVHYRAESEVYGKPLIFPGSVFRTQLLPVEAEVPKGFYMIEIEGDDVDFDFVELNSVRDFFYEEKEFNEAAPGEIKDWIREKTRELIDKPLRNKERIPLARLRLKGTLTKGSSRSEVSVNELIEEFEDKILLSITREDLVSPELEEQTQFLKDVREEKISMEERGKKILKSNLEELDCDERFDYEELFGLLSDDKVDGAFDRVSEVIEDIIEQSLEEKE